MFIFTCWKDDSGEQLSRRILLCSQPWLIALKRSPFLSVRTYHSIVDGICWTCSWRNRQVSNIFHWQISREKYFLWFLYIFKLHLHALIFFASVICLQGRSSCRVKWSHLLTTEYLFPDHFLSIWRLNNHSISFKMPVSLWVFRECFR